MSGLRPRRVGALLTAAEDEIWRRSRDEHTSGTLLEVFAGLRERGTRIGCSPTRCGPRDRHERIFVRDGVQHLIDGAVYTSEIPWTKPHPEAFRAAMAAVGYPSRATALRRRPPV